MSQQNNITVYTPASKLKKPWKLFRTIFKGFLNGRELAWILLKRNINARYRQSLLGIAWAFITPVFTMLLWVFLKNSQIFTIDSTKLPYPVYVLIGTVLWQLFSQSIQTPLQIVKDSKNMLVKINFPHEALLLTSFGQIVFDFLIKVLVLIPLFWWFSIIPTWTFLIAIAGIMLIILLGMSIGIILIPIGMLFGDLQRVVTVVLGFMFFLTPVVYPMPQKGIAGLIAKFNPISPILSGTRAWLAGGDVAVPTGFWLSIGGVSFLLFVGLVFYKTAMPHIIERAGS